MRYFLVLASAVIIRAVIQASGAAENGNVVPFNALCDIYNQALALRGIRSDFTSLREEVKQAMEEVEKLTTMTADDQFFEFGTRQPSQNNKEREEQKKAWMAINAKWMNEEIEVDGSKVKKYRRPINHGLREIAHRQLERIRARLKQEMENLDGIERRANASIDVIKQQANKAMTGEASKDEVEDSAFASTYASGCGGSAGSVDAGKTLPNDMVCLCVGATNSHGAAACGKVRVGSALTSLGYTNAAGAKGAWNTLKTLCPQNPDADIPNSAMVKMHLTTFKYLLGPKGAQNQNQDYILGTGQSGGTFCEGGSDDAQTLCVNYKTQLTKNNAKWDYEGVPWFAAMTALVKETENVESFQYQAKQVTQKASAMEELAWQAYLASEANTNSSPPNSVTQTTSDQQKVVTNEGMGNGKKENLATNGARGPAALCFLLVYCAA